MGVTRTSALGCDPRAVDRPGRRSLRWPPPAQCCSACSPASPGRVAVGVGVAAGALPVLLTLLRAWWGEDD